MSHATDPAVVKRLKRASGHLATTVRMVEENRDALDIAQQLQAVISALQKARRVLVTHHIEHHLEDLTGPLSPDARVQFTRLSHLAKYL